jgi:cytochrome c oxidase cbb3-type subunit 3
MVGNDPREVTAIARRTGVLSSRGRMGLGVCVVLLLGFAAWALIIGRQEAHLVRLDADSATADPGSMQFAIPRGRRIFAQRCADCHGRDGRGSNTLGSANLADQDWLYGRGAASDVETVVIYGIRAPNSRTWRLADMPAYAREHPYPREPAIKPLSPSDILDLVQFLRAAEGRSADENAALRGSKTFQSAGCYDCHGINAAGDGGIGAPNLTDNIWLYGDGADSWIYDSIAHGRAGMCPAWAGRLNAVQIREVALYVYSLSRARDGF